MRASLFGFWFVLLLVSAAQAADSLNVRLVGSCRMPETAYGVAVSGGYAFVADWRSGLRVISVADPAHPSEVGHIDTPDSAAGVAVSGNYAYVVGIQAGLRVISVSDPARPIEVGSYDTPGFALSVAVDGNFVYVADMDSGLWVISVSDPAHPTKVGRWHVSGSMIGNIAVAGHFVYVVDYMHGLRVISVADAAHPDEVGSNDSVGFGAVAVKGDYACVGNNGARLSVVSLADSTHPVEVGWCNGFEPALSIEVDGYAFVTGGITLSVVSMSDPAHPYTVAHSSLVWGSHDLATSGDYIYLASDSGLSVWQLYAAGVEETKRSGLRATECEPTVVRGALMLGATDRRQLAVDRTDLLDAAGRKVMDLRAGANDVRAMAPGVYFVREGGVSREQGGAGIRKVVIAR